MSLKESIFKNYLKDPLLLEKQYLTQDELDNIFLYQPHENRLIEIIRLVVNNFDPNDSESKIKNLINSYFAGRR